MLTIDILDEGRDLRLACRGRLDAESVGDFVAAAVPVIRAAGRGAVVADLSDLVHIDSSGLGALSHLARRLAQAGCRLAVEGLAGQPLALFRTTGLDRILAPAPRRPVQSWLPVPPRGIFEGA